MRKIEVIKGQTIPLDMNDVDTDLIIPAQYLTAVTKAGYGENLFRRLKENSSDFIFNQPAFKNANILITAKNFGCGSSREHAVWAIQEAGIEAIIAVSFADIFFNNSSKNGLVLISLPHEIIQNMLNQSKTGEYMLTIDIANQKIKSSLNEGFDFQYDPFKKHCLLHGLDDLDYLLSFKNKIENFKR